MFTHPSHSSSPQDPLLPWLLSIKKALEDECSGDDLNNLLLQCITTFKHNPQYRNDPRFLKIWFLYLEGSNDFEVIFSEMVENKICNDQSLLYEVYAAFLEVKEKWQEAYRVYQIGISRKAKPLERLKNAQALFLNRISERVNACSIPKLTENNVIYCQVLEMSPKSVAVPFFFKMFDPSAREGEEKIPIELETKINPWSPSTMKELLHKLNPRIKKYEGYYSSNKNYSGKMALSSLRNSSRNKVLEIGGKKYQIKGCAGQGGFAQVFKAYVNSSPDDVVALKIQTPPFPWEFHMYRQLDQRILDKQRSSFGSAHAVHLYADYSILVCDYLSHGTLQDVINSYAVIGKSMEEVLCMYYTVEMLYLLENLHRVGIIHGDFKPDNLLIRYSRDELTENGFHDRSGPWNDQGLCLVDWGRGIDLNLFSSEIEFEGDCRTSGFRCVEMQEKKPWKFQVDTYGLCVAVHMMLHNSYMGIDKKATSDGGYIYLPKASFKRYWNVELWRSLFTKLLNNSHGSDKNLLQDLRESFQGYLCSNPQLLKKLKDLLTKQRLSLCSA